MRLVSLPWYVSEKFKTTCKVLSTVLSTQGVLPLVHLLLCQVSWENPHGHCEGLLEQLFCPFLFFLPSAGNVGPMAGIAAAVLVNKVTGKSGIKSGRAKGIEMSGSVMTVELPHHPKTTSSRFLLHQQIIHLYSV